MIDLEAIPDDKPRKGPARMSKSEKDETIRRHVWALRWRKRNQYRAPVRRSYISVRWAPPSFMIPPPSREWLPVTTECHSVNVPPTL